MKICFQNLFNTFKASHPLKAGHKTGNFPMQNFFQKGRFFGYWPCTRLVSRKPAFEKISDLSRDKKPVSVRSQACIPTSALSEDM
jgi:hypothetical protein